MKRARTIASVVVAVALVALGAPPALACSCAIGDPRDALEGANAAIIGELVAKDVSDDGQDAVYSFDVEQVVKGELTADPLDVHAAAYGAACGIEADMGERIGLLLHRDREEHRWTSSLCSQIDPDVLLAAAEPLPPPDGDGPVRFVVGGNTGPNRLLALDRHGRVLAYGEGSGHTVGVEACPGGGRLVESAVIDRPASPPRLGTLVVRRTSSLRVLRSVTILESDWPSIYEVACLSKSGSRLLAVERHREEWWVHAVRWGSHDVVWHGSARSAFIAGGRAYVIREGILLEVPHTGGKLRRVATVPVGVDRVAFSADGDRVAMLQQGWAFQPNRDSFLIVADLASGASERTRLGSAHAASGEVAWWGERLVHLPRYGRARVFSSAGLELLGGCGPWQASASSIDGARAFAISWEGLIRADLPDGEVVSIRTFESPEIYALEVFPDT